MDKTKSEEVTVRSVRRDNGSASSASEVEMAILAPVPTDAVVEVSGVEETTREDRVDYHSLGWVKAALIMIAETISLGILSLPAVLAALGLVPGVILIVSFGLMATYTGFVVWQFKMRHPETRTIAHGMEIAFGRPGRWVAEITQDLMLLFVMAAHIVIFSVALNVLTAHATCTTAFMAAAAGVSFLVSLPRTMKGNSWFSLFSCISIATATLVALISIAIIRPSGTGRDAAHAILPAGLSTFPKAAVAVSSVVLAYNGHIAYPTIISEMKEPRDFPKALVLLESVTIAFYLVVAIVIYHYAGQGVSAPALGSASPLVRKIAYGFAVPTIVVAGVIVALVAAKQFYSYYWAKTPEVMEEKTSRARWSWRIILGAVWILAWVIACVIPIFGLLLGLIGAMFGTWFALGFPSLLWIGMNWTQGVRGKGWKKMSLAVLNWFIVFVSVAICVLGTYGSVKEIVAGASADGRKPFSCADNSL